MLAILLGCGLRRSEVAALTLKHIQQRDNSWCIVDPGGRYREEDDASERICELAAPGKRHAVREDGPLNFSHPLTRTLASGRHRHPTRALV
jgi:integrase